MALDEKLFGFLYRVARRAIKRSDQAPDGAAALFSVHAAELEVIASAVAERRVVLRAAAGAGAICGAQISLPEHLSLASDPTQNRRCYLARVVFDASVVRLGLTLAKPAASATERLLATLLAAPSVLEHIDQELPAARGLLDEVCALELASLA
jgi:hypothetical protein